MRARRKNLIRRWCKFTYRTLGRLERISAFNLLLNLVVFPLTDNYFVDDYARFSTLSVRERSTAVANSMNYMTKKGERALCPGLSPLRIEPVSL